MNSIGTETKDQGCGRLVVCNGVEIHTPKHEIAYGCGWGRKRQYTFGSIYGCAGRGQYSLGYGALGSDCITAANCVREPRTEFAADPVSDTPIAARTAATFADQNPDTGKTNPHAALSRLSFTFGDNHG